VQQLNFVRYEVGSGIGLHRWPSSDSDSDNIIIVVSMFYHQFNVRPTSDVGVGVRYFCSIVLLEGGCNWRNDATCQLVSSVFF
jgi:hypothetical protein